MAKTLEFTINSPRQIKQGDTETTFTFICKSAGSAVDLTQATSITAKIGNASGYLRSQPIATTSLTGLNPGWLNLQPTPTLISGLPDGDYQLEIWVVDQAGTSIYPSDAPLGFTITNNIESASGASITTVAFDDFVKEMHKAASTIAKGDPGEGLDIKGQVTSVSALPATANEGDGYLVNEELYVYTSGAWKDCGTIQGPQGIQGKTGTGISSTTIQYQISNSATTAPTGTWSNDIVATTTANPYLWMKATLNYTDNTTKDFYLISQKGDKGDTGTVDNTGLINSQAFQSLQTQVDNSAVGTNLLTGTGYHTVTGATNKGYLSNETIDDLLTLFKGLEGQTITVSVDYKYSGFVAGSGQNRLGWETVIYADSTLPLSSWYYPKNDSGSGRISSTFVVPKNITGAIEGMGYIQFFGSGTGTLSHFKLEKGSVATDWCPNPTEVLTQSDYAKIKAAIVALGGALS